MKVDRMEASPFLDDPNWCRMVLENVPNTAVFWFDRDIRYLDACGEALAQNGLSREGVIGKTLWDVFPSEITDTIEPACRAALQGERATYRVTVNDRHFEGIAMPMKVAGATVQAGVAIVRDVSQIRSQTEELQSQAIMLNQISDRITATDMDGVITYVNDAVVNSLGKTREQLVGQSVRTYGNSPETRGRQSEIIETTRTKGEWRGEVSNYGPDEREVVLDTRTTTIVDDHGNPVGMIGISTDITDRKNTERQLRESEARFRALFEHSLTGTLFINPDGSVLEVNDRLLEILGSPSKEASKQINVLTTPQLVASGFAGSFRKCLESGEPVFGESWYTSVWGKSAYLRYYFNPIKDEDVIIGALASVDDVTALHSATKELQRRNREIEQMLREREVLLRELYHRTKNNMQVMASLVNLQRNNVKEESTNTLLAELESKIQGMALVHEKLYESSDLSRLDLGEYLEDLVHLIAGSYYERLNRVSFETSVEPIPTLLDVAVPLGLVIHELVTNALKHAFPDDRQGSVRIELKQHDVEGITVTVADDGVGLPPSVRPAELTSLGLKTAMSIVAQQLQGRISVTRPADSGESGTVWTIVVDDHGYQPRV